MNMLNYSKYPSVYCKNIKSPSFVQTRDLHRVKEEKITTPIFQDLGAHRLKQNTRCTTRPKTEKHAKRNTFLSIILSENLRSQDIKQSSMYFYRKKCY